MRAEDSVVGFHPSQLGVIMGSQVGVHHTHRHTVDLEPGPLEIRVMGVIIRSQVGVHHTHRHTADLEPRHQKLGSCSWNIAKIIIKLRRDLTKVISILNYRSPD